MENSSGEQSVTDEPGEPPSSSSSDAREPDEQARSPWLRTLALALILALALLGEERGVEHIAAWGSRASAAALELLRGSAAADVSAFAREASARADAAVDKISAQLRLSRDHVSRGTVSLGDNAPFYRLLERAADIQLRGAGHITVLAFGGSSTTGADLDRLDEIFAAVFGRALGDVLSVPVVVLNAAVGGTGSDYYAVCASQHLSSNVDVVLTENAVNDGITLVGDKLEPTAIMQQLILSVQALAPHAALVYAGLLGPSCRTGEDIPGILAVYKLYNISIVSTRNLIFEPPSSWGDPAACPELQAPFVMYEMFKGKNHAGSLPHAYLALLILNVLKEQFRVAAAAPKSVAKQFRLPLLDALPYAGRPFDCKSTLSPRFGAPLVPVPTPGCEAVWTASGEPELVGSGCNGLEASQLWGDSVSETPLSSEVKDFPLVENWELSSASFFAPDKPDSVRQDHKFNWDSLGAGAPITFLIRVGGVGTVAVGYLKGDEFYGAATFRISNAAGVEHSAEISDEIKGARHTHAVILFRDLAAGWWRLRVEPHARFGLCAIATT
jgi:hypothetical protein